MKGDIEYLWLASFHLLTTLCYKGPCVTYNTALKVQILVPMQRQLEHMVLLHQHILQV